MSKNLYANYLKRLIDFAVALVLAVMLLPIALALALAIKISSRGPVVFKQKRSGKHGHTFMMYKFRSMAKDNDVMSKDCADKVTKAGSFMRKTSLDELPQIVNVLKGDMSFIGPRPWITEYRKHFTTQQKLRNNVRPGITGRAQAYGRNALSIHDKIKHDLEYVERISFREDIRIVLQTLKTLRDKSVAELGKSGIHEELAELRAQWHNMYDRPREVWVHKQSPKTKILFVITSIRQSGPNKVLESMLHGIDRNKYEPTVLSFMGSGNSIRNMASELDTPVINLDFQSQVNAYMQGPARFRSFVAKFRPDIIHTHGLLPDIASASLNADTKRITTIHNRPFEDFVNRFGRFRGIMLARIHLAVIQRLDYIVCCSEASYKHIRDYAKITHISYIQNGTPNIPRKNKKDITVERDKTRRSLGIPSSDAVYVFAGSLVPGKNIRYLVDSFINSSFKNEHLVIIGDGPEKSYCAERSKDSNLHVIGWADDVKKYLAASDVYISASLSEGFPISVLEALENNLLVLLSDIDSHAELLSEDKSHSVGTLFEFEDFKKGIDKIRNTLQKEYPAGKSPVAFKNSHFSAKKMMEKYEEIYSTNS